MSDNAASDHVFEFAHEPDVHRYSMRIDSQLVCVVDYSINRNAIALTRTYTQPQHRGNGHAADLVEFAVNDIETTTTYRIVPTCWYVGEWFDKHPSRANLLSR